MRQDSRKKKALYILILVITAAAVLGVFLWSSKTKEEKTPEESAPGEQVSSEEDTGETVVHEAPETYVEGTIEGDHYENKWLGIQFDAPKGFHMYSRKELDNRVEDAESQEEESMTIDMCASSNDMGSVEIHVEKKGPLASAKEYLEGQQKEMLEKDGKVMKFKNNGTLSKETIGGQEYDSLKLEYTLDGMEFCSERYARIADKCIVVIQIDYDPANTADRDAVMEAVQAL